MVLISVVVVTLLAAAVLGVWVGPLMTGSQSELKSMKSKHEATHSKLKKLEDDHGKKCADYDTKCEEYNAKCSELTGEIGKCSLLNQKKQDLTQQVTEEQAQHKQLRNNVRALQREIQQKTAEIKENTTEIQQHKTEIQQKNQRIQNLLELSKVGNQLITPDERESLTVLCGTWNAGNKNPTLQPGTKEDLPNCLSWIQPRATANGRPVDMVVIGLQEANYFWNFRSGQHFRGLLSGHLGYEYELVGEKFNGQMRIYVFATRIALAKHDISAGTIMSVNRGLGTDLGRHNNKGAVVVSLNCNSTSICFVAAHLAAHQDEKILDDNDELQRPYFDRRNEDFKEIMRQIGGLANANALVVMGDLNYRTDYKRDEVQKKAPSLALFREMTTMIHSGNLQPLLETDELLQAIEKRGALGEYGFREAKIRFKPTFKLKKTRGIHYIPWDIKKGRSPAWCDRVLFKSRVKGAVKCSTDKNGDMYDSHPDVPTSDHKPVTAFLEIELSSD